MTYSFFSLDVMSNPAPWSIDGSSPKNTEISQVFDLITQYIKLHKVLCIVIYIYILLVIVYINNLSHCTRLSPLFCSCCFNRLFTFNEYSIYRLLSTVYSDTVSDISINGARIDVHVSVSHLFQQVVHVQWVQYIPPALLLAVPAAQSSDTIDALAQ